MQASTGPQECPKCDGTGWVPDPSACGDPEHCGPAIPCTACEGTGFIPSTWPTVPHTSNDWAPGDPCAACGSRETVWDPANGATCKACARTDADE